MIHLSNSSGHTRRPNPSPKTRQLSGCPADPAHPSAMKSAARVQPGASSPRRLEPANRSVNRPSQARQRPDPSTPRNQKDSDRPIQSPGSAPLTNNPKDRQNPAPPTGGPRRPVGEMGYKGARTGRQSKKRGKREKACHGAVGRIRLPHGHRGALARELRTPSSPVRGLVSGLRQRSRARPARRRGRRRRARGARLASKSATRTRRHQCG